MTSDTPDSSSETRDARPRVVSIPLIVITGVTFVLGLVLGFLTFANRSPQPSEHHPGDNMIFPHLVVAAVVLAGAAVLTLTRRSLRWVGAPFSARTGSRISATFRGARDSVIGVLRCIAFLVLAIFVLYLVLRMGLQATGGLDPNFARNAWGGPTAIGAFAAHGVDALACIGLASLLGHLVLRRSAGTSAVRTAGISSDDLKR